MSFPKYINFQVNNNGGGMSNMVVHSHAVILMLISRKFQDFFSFFRKRCKSENTSHTMYGQC